MGYKGKKKMGMYSMKRKPKKSKPVGSYYTKKIEFKNKKKS
jgi:hypothetical protein